MRTQTEVRVKGREGEGEDKDGQRKTKGEVKDIPPSPFGPNLIWTPMIIPLKPPSQTIGWRLRFKSCHVTTNLLSARTRQEMRKSREGE